MALMREELDRGRSHREGGIDPGGAILRSVVTGEMPVYISAHTPDEIVAAIRIIDEYGLEAALVGAEQGDEVAEMIAERDIPVIYAPLLLFSKDKELSRVGRMAGAGVKVAFASAAPRTHLNDLRTSAIIATKYGLSPELALRSLTINAAEILGLADRVGSIESGKDADLVILNGDPLELTSSVEVVLVNGNIVYRRKEK
jgi:imidazolonepropionase-like amidohydrolase